MNPEEKKLLAQVMTKIARKGGKAAAAALTPKQRVERARKAGKASGKARVKKGGRP